MSNTPSKAEIEALVKRHGATSYRNRADTQHPAYGFTEDGLNGLIDEVLAKWGSPQPVAREPLTANQVSELAKSAEYWHGDIRRSDFINGFRYAEAAHGITKKRGQHGTE